MTRGGPRNMIVSGGCIPVIASGITAAAERQDVSSRGGAQRNPRNQNRAAYAAERHHYRPMGAFVAPLRGFSCFLLATYSSYAAPRRFARRFCRPFLDAQKRECIPLGLVAVAVPRKSLECRCMAGNRRPRSLWRWRCYPGRRRREWHGGRYGAIGLTTSWHEPQRSDRLREEGRLGIVPGEKGERPWGSCGGFCRPHC